MRFCQEEIFEPMLSLIIWDDYEIMVVQAKEYDLVAGIYTSNLKHILEMPPRREDGSVWINRTY